MDICMATKNHIHTAYPDAVFIVLASLGWRSILIHDDHRWMVRADEGHARWFVVDLNSVETLLLFVLGARFFSLGEMFLFLQYFIIYMNPWIH